MVDRSLRIELLAITSWPLHALLLVLQPQLKKKILDVIGALRAVSCISSEAAVPCTCRYEAEPHATLSSAHGDTGWVTASELASQ